LAFFSKLFVIWLYVFNQINLKIFLCVKILKIYIYNEIKILKFGQSMKNMIMIKEKENFERGPLLKCVKLQVSNVFSAKLISFFSLKC